MSSFVIDASVVAAAIFGEEHALIAQRLLADAAELLAPDFITVEVANVIWKRHVRGEVDLTEAMDLFADVNRLPLSKTSATDLLRPALELALRLSRSVYDSLYLALAVQTSTIMITADRRL